MSDIASILQHKAPDGNLYFLYSFPRSGNTWMRMAMAAAVIKANGLDQAVGQNDVVPTTSGKVEFDSWQPVVELPFLMAKTHLEQDLIGAPFVYLYRNPYDVVRSWVRYIVKKPIEQIEEGEKMRFCERGTREITAHIRGAIDRYEAAPERVLFMSYESMHNDLVHQLDKVFQFLGYPIDTKVLEAITPETKIEQFAAHHNPNNFMFNEGQLGLGAEDLPEAGVQLISEGVMPICDEAREIEIEQDKKYTSI